MRRSKLFVLMKSLFDKTTHRQLQPPPTDAGTTMCIWNLRLAMEPSMSVVRPAVSDVVAAVDDSLGGPDLKSACCYGRHGEFECGSEPFDSNALHFNSALNRKGAGRGAPTSFTRG